MPKIYEDEEFVVYNENAYITVQYLDKSTHIPILENFTKDGRKRLRLVGYKHEPVWKIFRYDFPRSNLEFALKVIVKQRMRNK